MLGTRSPEVQSRLDRRSFYVDRGLMPVGAGASAHLSISSPRERPQNPTNTCHSRPWITINSFPSLYFGCLINGNQKGK